MQITRLRLLGFKSFVEPSELLIESGLTGVVGPNGCGKSNLLEALRWVMGETSYKNMRGGAMDDVIFAGTDRRPARNMAEVSLAVDNSTRSAPSEFNDTDTLEITRRIQREAGSTYKINSKDVRAKDVQILFADAATGARSQALVRQGQIGEIISAKPQDRRRILEDAAGIAGLHSRRHDAELRLKAAESNLERLSDVMGQLGSQLQSLRRQAKQAQKYKQIAGELRKYEGILAYQHWHAATQSVEAEEGALLNATRNVGQFTQAEAAAMRVQSEIAESLQPLRDEEATRAAVLHRLEVERQTLQREEQRAQERQAELESRLSQLQEDIERETAAIGEAKELLQKLAEEEEELRAVSEEEAASRESLQEAVAEAGASLETAEAALQAATAEGAEARASRAQAENRINECAQRLSRLTAQAAQFQQQLAELGDAPEAAAEIEILREQADQTAAEMEDVEARTAEAETALPEARNREKQARDAASQARLKARQLETEVATLVKLLKPDDSAKWRPVVDEIRVTPGYEIALGAALTDDLDAGLAADAPVRWSYVSGDGDPALPSGAQPLGELVAAPQELGRRLAQIGVVSREQGASLQPMLKPGQRLVSKQGDVWRWDGFISAGDAPSAAAKRLEERNRLGQLEEQVAVFIASAEEAEAQREAASEAVNRIQQDEKNLRDRWRQLNARLSSIKDKLSAADRAVQQHSSKRASVMETAERIASEREEAAASQAEAENLLAMQAPLADLEARLQACQAEAAAKRNAYAEAKSRADSVEREIRARQTRLEAIVGERKRWLSRDESAGQHIATLHERVEAVRAELAELKELPARIEERRQKILNELSQAEEARRNAATQLAEAENSVRNQERALREAQKALSEAREERARIEARLEGARERRRDQAQHIRDTFECAASELLATLELDPEAQLPATEEVEQQIVKLRGDRERLGGVNLRAEEEADVLGAEFDGMEKERADLEEAIGKLRTAITNLNKEGRKRLMEAFDTVNGHFQRLFKVLFGGGDAELQLIESDDPLESGLELLCRPPGKKPQVLTLLSGGEKALTALALIFAVFLTNPSPICVLDEVDAPLDDSNVHRFCAMLDEMRKTTKTRFLVITHNPITMATMDRLFGVTMQEKGISQLVSVDLQTAERFREVG